MTEKNFITFTIPSSSHSSVSEGGDVGCVGDDDGMAGAASSTAYSTSALKIKIGEATIDDTNQGENETNTGFVMWPSAVMLSYWLQRHPSLVFGNNDDGDKITTHYPKGDIMELGAGCGLAGLTAATMMQNNKSSHPGRPRYDSNSSDNDDDDRVIFTDYNPAVLLNLRDNILLNDFDVDHEVYGLDWFDQQSSNNYDDDKGDGSSEHEDQDQSTWVDMNGISHKQVRLIIGADLMVCSNDADLVATTIDCALIEGGQAIILGADEYTRFGVRGFPDACRSVGLDVTVQENVLQSFFESSFNANAAKRHNDDASRTQEQQLIEELELGGYNQRSATFGHEFTMFTINKPFTP